MYMSKSQANIDVGHSAYDFGNPRPCRMEDGAVFVAEHVEGFIQLGKEVEIRAQRGRAKST